MDGEDQRFISRKFILTVIVLILVSVLPMVYKANGVSEIVTMTVLGLLGAVGAAYGFINVKDAKNDIERKAAELISKGTGSSETSK